MYLRSWKQDMVSWFKYYYILHTSLERHKKISNVSPNSGCCNWFLKLCITIKWIHQNRRRSVSKVMPQWNKIVVVKYQMLIISHKLLFFKCISRFKNYKTPIYVYFIHLKTIFRLALLKAKGVYWFSSLPSFLSPEHFFLKG